MRFNGCGVMHNVVMLRDVKGLPVRTVTLLFGVSIHAVRFAWEQIFDLKL